MEIESTSDLMNLQFALKQEFGDIPDNLIVVSKKIVEEAHDIMGVPDELRSSNIKIHGIKVVRDYAELIV